jgi:uncharacterized protein YlxP (DUF503 family)
MVVAVLQFELLIPSPESIKDKRRVVRSVRDRLHREHLVSVAEVRFLDSPGVAGMAVALVNRDATYARGVLDTIIHKLRALRDAELGDHWVEILPADQLPQSYSDEDGTPLWTPEEARDPVTGTGPSPSSPGQTTDDRS